MRNERSSPRPSDDLLHDRDAERPDQLVLQVGYAHEEAQSLHLGSSEAVAEPGALEAAPEVALFAGVTEAGQPRVEPAGPEPLQKPADGLRAPDRNDGDALGVERSTAAPGKRLERALVARSFDQHYGTREMTGRVHAGSVHAGPIVRPRGREPRSPCRCRRTR